MDSQKQVYRVDKKSLLNELSIIFNKITFSIPSVEYQESIYPDANDIAKGILDSMESAGSLVVENMVPKETIDKTLLDDLYLMGVELQGKLEKVKEDANEKLEEAHYNMSELGSDINSALDDLESNIYDAKSYADNLEVGNVDPMDCEVRLNEFIGSIENLREALDIEKEEEQDEED